MRDIFLEVVQILFTLPSVLGRQFSALDWSTEMLGLVYLGIVASIQLVVLVLIVLRITEIEDEFGNRFINGTAEAGFGFGFDESSSNPGIATPEHRRNVFRIFNGEDDGFDGDVGEHIGDLSDAAVDESEAEASEAPPRNLASGHIVAPKNFFRAKGGGAEGIAGVPRGHGISLRQSRGESGPQRCVGDSPASVQLPEKDALSFILTNSTEAQGGSDSKAAGREGST